ncbi:MAG: nodulation protein NfeD [Calditrichaeota bacterium]|nr:nodulation protein NfeD [Calditrichota bacterium]MCB9366497.1 nodulation protein NfeD [Calditrichota bacterium]MCB9391245.1 nodulation protein NfeD [Calditrichota bacterium]
MVESALELARQENAEALIIELDTPGGLLKTTRIMCKSILASPVPVIVYVAPSGARAGSAGVFITLASHVAAMAPGTNIGAAHPVGLGGFGSSQDTSGVMEGKVTNDAAAFARTLAEQRGRNAEWAELAVRESKSITEYEALELGVIELIAPSADSLLTLLHGRIVSVDGRQDTLDTSGAIVAETPMSLRLRILDFIADPNIAYILLLLGIYGLFFELYNPGAIFPGVVGAMSLVLAFFSLQLLPISWAGLALIVLAIILFVLEIKITSYGLLSIAGVLSMVLGSLMLFQPGLTGLTIGLGVVIPAAILTAAFFLFVVGMGLRAQARKVVTGAEGLIGEIAVVTTPLALEGKVSVHGEIWSAQGDVALPIGARVKVTRVDGMLLTVESVKPASTT